MRSPAAVVLFVLVALLAGCGGGPAEDTVVGEIAEGLRADSDPGAEQESLIAEPEAQCFAETLVTAYTVDGLVEDRVINEEGRYLGQPDAASEELAREWVAALDECVGVPEHMVDLTRLVMGIVDERMDDRDRTWARILTCVKKRADIDELRAGLDARLRGDQFDGSDEAFNRCVAVAEG